MVWILLLSLLLLFLAYLLFAPLCLEIDTERNRYCIRFHVLAGLFIRQEENEWTACLKILFWKRNLSTEKMRQSAMPGQKKEHMKTKSKRAVPVKKLLALVRSFRVKRCVLIIDTGDVQANAFLFPLFYHAARSTGHDIRISFTGETTIILFIKNNLARMVRAWIVS